MEIILLYPLNGLVERLLRVTMFARPSFGILINILAGATPIITFPMTPSALPPSKDRLSTLVKALLLVDILIVVALVPLVALVALVIDLAVLILPLPTLLDTAPSILPTTIEGADVLVAILIIPKFEKLPLVSLVVALTKKAGVPREYILPNP